MTVRVWRIIFQDGKEIRRELFFEGELRELKERYPRPINRNQEDLIFRPPMKNQKVLAWFEILHFGNWIMYLDPRRV